jgi:hypothetical protein
MFYNFDVIKAQSSKKLQRANFLFRIFTKVFCSSFVANEYILGKGAKQFLYTFLCYVGTAIFDWLV